MNGYSSIIKFVINHLDIPLGVSIGNPDNEKTRFVQTHIGKVRHGVSEGSITIEFSPDVWDITGMKNWNLKDPELMDKYNEVEKRLMNNYHSMICG